jgi:hypothetical protein
MINKYWFEFIPSKDLEYLKRFSVTVVSSRLLAELLHRIGIGCIRYIGDFITPNDVAMDVSLKSTEANDYDVPDCRFYSYPFIEDVKEVKRQVKGSDIIIAHKHVDLFARVAYDLGVPFIPNIATVFLPDGIPYFKVKIPKVTYDPISYTITCSIQACEVLKLLTGYDKPIIAPKAYIVDLKNNKYIKEIILENKYESEN